MRLSLINQYASTGTTSARLCELLDGYAREPNAQFRSLVGFASRAGLDLIAPSLEGFLRRGLSTFWIVGLDLGGTGREALEFIHALARRYRGQVDARVFSLGDNRIVFHPKVYWLDSDARRTVLIGSANATAGGLSQNFEVSTQIELEEGSDDQLREELDHLWIAYSSPLPPVTAANLVPIDARLISKVGRDAPPTDGQPMLPHPLKGIVPRLRIQGNRLPKRRSISHRSMRGTDRQLIMDILQETRRTQVQIPVESFGPFFDAKKNSIVLRHRLGGGIVKSDQRPFIHLQNNTHRIEIDAIRGLPRPQIIRLWRRKDLRGVFDYEIVLKGTKAYTEFDRILEAEGRRTRTGARRWAVLIQKGA